ncbi:sodium-dependent transporter [Salinisphaera sp. Q1T1-3]|uniref:sodium-dependent transporter n=1 Tax=Salinisphaera sp. Q1T1-3 TaxID=2321229 RepID=UPI000E74A1B0|nr:sodium-dependent transporter [Salinisphaera sp. Q1T1-3]RJS94680.1 sodium-dependent transporter [Salinisphaera sp. Q1T1-3]
MTQTRSQWGSRLGFIMAAAGSAVGLGNIWKFPYMTGENGGGAFLVLYMICIVVFGLSLVIAELLIGRMAQKTPVAAFRETAGRGWSVVGGLAILTAFVILSFYIVVAGWTLAYTVFEATGSLSTMNSEALSATFKQLTGNPWQPVGYAGLFMLVCVAVVISGIGSGIERASKLLMPILFVLLVVLVVRAVTLPGAQAGIAFFIVPDFSKVTSDTVVAAIGQAFFSLSLGMGAMVTYGSYLSRERNLPVDALAVVGLDTLIAVLAGFMVLPAMFAAGLEPGDGGAGTTFLVLPAVFEAMPAGSLFGFVFFVLLAVAALTSAISLLEAVVCYLTDEFRIGRVAATVGTAVACLLLAIPSSLSFGPLAKHTLFGQKFFDLLDYVTTWIALPVGGILTALCVGWVLGPRAVTALTNQGRLAAPWAGVWLFVLRFIAPVGIGWILIQGLIK